MKNQKCAATLTIHNIGDMTPEGRKKVIGFLRRQLSLVNKYTNKVAKRFRARYLYV